MAFFSFLFYFLTHLTSINSTDYRVLGRKPRSIFAYNWLQRETLEDLFIPREKLQHSLCCLRVNGVTFLPVEPPRHGQRSSQRSALLCLPRSPQSAVGFDRAAVSRGKRRSQRNALISIVLHSRFRIRRRPPTLTNFLFVSRNKSSSNPLPRPTRPTLAPPGSRVALAHIKLC